MNLDIFKEAIVLITCQTLPIRIDNRSGLYI